MTNPTRAYLCEKYDVLILDFTVVPLVDYTTSKSIHDMIGDAIETNRKVYLVGMTGQVATLLERLGVLKTVSQKFKLSSRIDALKSAIKNVSYYKYSEKFWLHCA